MAPAEHPATDRVATPSLAQAPADETNAAIDSEHSMTVRQSLRFWWKAIVFSFVISLCVIMEGYDTSLMNNFFPFPAFKNKFGDEDDPDGGRLVSPRWQTIILNGTQVSPSLVYRSSVCGHLIDAGVHCAGRLHHWSHHQWIRLRVGRLQEDYGHQHDCHDWCYLHPILLYWLTHVPRWRSRAGTSMGCFPDAGHFVRC